MIKELGELKVVMQKEIDTVKDVIQAEKLTRMADLKSKLVALNKFCKAYTNVTSRNLLRYIHDAELHDYVPAARDGKEGTEGKVKFSRFTAKCTHTIVLVPDGELHHVVGRANTVMEPAFHCVNEQTWMSAIENLKFAAGSELKTMIENDEDAMSIGS